MGIKIAKVHKYQLLKLFPLIVFIGCTGGTPQSNTENGATYSDSIFSQIKKGRDLSLTPELRHEYLEKAYIQANQSENDSLKVKYFSRLSIAYLRLEDSLLFRKANSETINLALKTKDSVVSAEAHWDLAEFYQKNAVLDSAYFHFEESYQLYRALNDKYHEGRMLYNMAVVQKDIKDYTGSESTTINAIEILKPLKKYKELYSCYNNLAVVSNNLSEYDRAIEYHQTALDYLNKFDNKSILQYITLNNIGVVYKDKGEYEKAIPYFQEVLATDDLHEANPQLYARSLNNLAYNRLMSGDTLGVEQELIKAFHVRDSIGDITGIGGSHYSLAELYLSRQDTTRALASAVKAKYFAEQSSNNDRLLETLELLSRLDPKSSMMYTKQYIDLNDRILREERQARNKFARIRFETDEFIAENEMLTKENQIWTGIAVGLLLLGGAIYIIVDQRAKNQKLRFQQQQQASNQEIFSLMLSQNQKVEEGKQTEQKRISEELHDGVLGKMLGARMVLTGLNKKVDAQAISERALAILALKEVEGEVRAISHELSHSAYQKIPNFISSIKELLKNVGDASGIKMDFKYNDNTDWDALSGEIKINSYRMVQEILQNSVKHANCKNVFLNFVVDESNLDITIIDDGQGFQASKGKKGIGMRNIASRIDKVNGTWNISSELNKGTTITLKIPTAFHSMTE
ncbi:tetratricopeptide repeat protein [uncultured Kriegella sp.]|uniref:ATP-binding protein n=1 Tax=uncultured Kriegella sp. TaxID=1798910 RepID=UPI0030DAB421|tara:strand:+ start:332766 stop:334829 length:2064 start_codon:yes stop_codon:yes gene_type:complete